LVDGFGALFGRVCGVWREEVREESVDVVGEFGYFLSSFFWHLTALFVVEHLEKFTPFEILL
jgi:hypothetical protein